MFVAGRDLRFARGRFALMGTVIVLITLLVVLLSGLTAGLARQNISAITSLKADRVAFQTPPTGQKPSFTDSQVTAAQWQAWAGTPGVSAAEPLGISSAKAVAGDRSTAVAAFGTRPDAGLAPGPQPADGQVTLSADAAKGLGVGAGGTVRLAGTQLTVASVAGDASFSHLPVAWMSLTDWQRTAPGTGGGEPIATVIALRTLPHVDTTAADRAAGTKTVARDSAVSAIGSYTSENGSLQLMRAFLFAISALVVGAFFTVWTIQRSGDVAVLKALGASTAYLLRDAMGQAVVLLTAGTALGAALAAGLGTLVSGSSVPFVLSGATVAGPALVMIVLGALGAALSVRKITSVDPLTALGSAR
jgi:putative ABC transport system permease protein